MMCELQIPSILMALNNSRRAALPTIFWICAGKESKMALLKLVSCEFYAFNDEATEHQVCDGF